MSATLQLWFMDEAWKRVTATATVIDAKLGDMCASK